jgi:hypothetical protein
MRQKKKCTVFVNTITRKLTLRKLSENDHLIKNISLDLHVSYKIVINLLIRNHPPIKLNDFLHLHYEHIRV